MGSGIKLKTVPGTESRARTRSEIENKTGVKIECGISIRIESLIGNEIQNMKELFVLGFVQIRTVIGHGRRHNYFQEGALNTICFAKHIVKTRRVQVHPLAPPFRRLCDW
ncbi:hypothetical protein EVAR_12030_1 [Eumeta japonica]|uniref:Uncharacterized protein n=1 Tax=Eumeta variegata TaxID=151549 RepID=A0A4C1U546_EUMVA|nr:hypothetical protein EVAR_12030_1 [Eumeta japonica]